jgi:hypothetical protein
MSECCETHCESHHHPHHGCCEKRPCEPEPCCSKEKECPIECAAEMWKGSFFQAMREVQVDILKVKIRERHGEMMEQAAHELLESMNAIWQAKMAEAHAAEAACGFKEKLCEIMSQHKK